MPSAVGVAATPYTTPPTQARRALRATRPMGHGRLQHTCYLCRVTLGTIPQRVAVRITRPSPTRDHEHEHEHGTGAPIVFAAALCPLHHTTCCGPEQLREPTHPRWEAEQMPCCSTCRKPTVLDWRPRPYKTARKRR